MDSTLKVVIVLLAAAVACLLIMMLIMYVGRKCLKSGPNSRQDAQGVGRASSEQELADSGKWELREGGTGIGREDICAVCLESGMNVLTRCGHSFHTACLGEWFKRNVSCPVCKNSSVRLLRVYCRGCRSCHCSYSFSGNFCELIRTNFACKDCQPHQIPDKSC